MRGTALCLAAILAVMQPALVGGHGRLLEPPSRATMWRFGFKNPPNYNDHELFCGGLTRMIRNGGKCGLCGDSYDAPVPRPHEAGGQYGNGIIVRTYQAGQVIAVKVELTAHHKGYFEIKLCNNNNPKKDPQDEKCFDEHVLTTDNLKDTRFYVANDPKNATYDLRYVLPKSLTCSQCVLQWTYVAGNNWGRCPNGTEAIGCGYQETFRACADVRIEQNGSSEVDTNEIPSASSHLTPFTVPQLLLLSLLISSYIVIFKH